jgi:hypothetical protein
MSLVLHVCSEHEGNRTPVITCRVGVILHVVRAMNYIRDYGHCSSHCLLDTTGQGKTHKTIFLAFSPQANYTDLMIADGQRS